MFIICAFIIGETEAFVKVNLTLCKKNKKYGKGADMGTDFVI